jgi:23S rRNA pseudouridine1911/1915/1917 synthase
MSNPKVIYENADFLVLLKPAGLLMHPFRVGTERGKEIIKEPTLTDWLKKHYPETKKVGDNPEMRPGLVHRLDRETSGLVIVARNQKTFCYFKSLFQKGGVKKTYLALVNGRLKEKSGRIEKPISLKPGTIRRTVHGGKMTKEAITEYETVETFSNGESSFSLLRVKPLTGRTHQIRVHLASIGHPILGDTLYGRHDKKGEVGIKSGRLMLHALELSFMTETGDLLEIESPPPLEFEEVIGSLREGGVSWKVKTEGLARDFPPSPKA